MKQIILTPVVLCLMATATLAQADTTTAAAKPDTIRVGGIIIINKKGDNPDATIGGTGSPGSSNLHIEINRSPRSPKRLKTSWLNWDLGFSNYNDQTNYSTAAAQEYARTLQPGEPSFTSSDLRLNNLKSVNFNLWIVKQRYGLTKDNKLQAKWGLMLESNNYRYETPISYDGGIRPFLFRDEVSFRKNKLAADYITVPLMLGFNTKPRKANGFAASAGVSLGYLYSSRSKQVSAERGKEKNRGNFDLEPFKFQYIGEVGLGVVKLYGSYAPRSIYSRGLDVRPFNIGFRVGEWW